MQGIIDGRLFGYVQCDIVVPEYLSEYFSHFPPTFKNTVVSRDDIGNLRKQYAEKKHKLVQPKKNAQIRLYYKKWHHYNIFAWLYLKVGLVCENIHWFVHYTPRKSFNKFVQSAVGARRHADENPNSSVVVETIKLLANSSLGYQIMGRSRHTMTKYLTD